jgi:hypothetical protein
MALQPVKASRHSGQTKAKGLTRLGGIIACSPIFTFVDSVVVAIRLNPKRHLPGCAVLFAGICEFPAMGLKVDRQFPVDMDGELDTGIDKHGIVVLGLPLFDPLGQFI